MTEDGAKMRSIEEGIFVNVVKKEVEEQLGPWKGSPAENKLADMRISGHIKTSFRIYEKSKKDPNVSVFKF